MIKIIRGSDDAPEASARLQAGFELSERQAEAILNMRLARLTGLEMEKLDAELAQIRERIAELRNILDNRDVRMDIIKDELNGLAEKYGEGRRTAIIGQRSDLSMEDMIADEEMVLTISHQGYVKRLPTGTYKAQRRGGRGLQGMGTKEEDWVEHLFVASTHDYLMIFTRQGKCHWLKVWQVPQAGRHSRGKPMVNLVNLEPGDEIASVVPVREFSSEKFLLFATRKGVIKKTPLSAYGNVRSVGLNAINIREEDELIDVRITDGESEIVLASRKGKAIRFMEENVRVTGRVSAGVRGIRLRKDDVVVGMVVIQPESTLLVVTEAGMGKRSEVDAYRLQGRGGYGVINIRTSEKTGDVVTVRSVMPDEELMFITKNGVVNRQRVDEIRVIGRATQGVRLVTLDKKDQVMDVARVIADNGEDEGEEGAEGTDELNDELTADAEASDTPVGS